PSLFTLNLTPYTFPRRSYLQMVLCAHPGAEVLYQVACRCGGRFGDRFPKDAGREILVCRGEGAPPMLLYGQPFFPRKAVEQLEVHCLGLASLSPCLQAFERALQEIG